MSSINVTVATVLDTSAALCNDTQKQVYTYAAQLPYFNLALRELEEIYEENNIPVTDEYSTTVEVDAGITEITFSSGLPTDLVEIRKLWESERDVDNWIPMIKVSGAFHGAELVSSFGTWIWKTNKIVLPESNRDNDIKIDYIRSLFTTVTDTNTTLGVINSQVFLEFRTASLCSQYIGEDRARALDLYNQAIDANNRALNISTKGKQSIAVRRKPFRFAYKARRR
jgi:hypothetical protein